MMFLNMYEMDQIVGCPDATAERQFVLGSFDTPSHAFRVLAENEERLTDNHHATGGWMTTRTTAAGTRKEFSVRLVDRKHPHEFGDVIRTTWIGLTMSK